MGLKCILIFGLFDWPILVNISSQQVIDRDLSDNDNDGENINDNSERICTCLMFDTSELRENSSSGEGCVCPVSVTEHSYLSWARDGRQNSTNFYL